MQLSNKTRQRQRTIFILSFLLPSLCLFVLFIVYPMLRGLYISFFKWSGSARQMEFIGFANYVQMFKDNIVWRALANDYFLVFWKVLLIMLIATFIAVALTRFRIKRVSFFRVVFFFPNIVSVVVVGVLWRFIYNPNIGFLNSFLSLFTNEPVTTVWLGHPKLALWSLVPPSVWAGIGLYMILIMAAILNIPKEIYEAAEIDGASQSRQFWTITLPLTWEQIKVSILHIVITTLNGSFIIVWLMTEGGPDNRTQVMGSYLYQMGFKQYHMGYAAAIGVLILVVSLITAVVLYRILKRETVEM